jgi:5-formyltetrahydrofolate cyclo-ligase
MDAYSIERIEQERLALRRQLLAVRDQLSPRVRDLASQRIIASLFHQPLFNQQQSFFIYCHYRSEVESTTLRAWCLAHEKHLSVPLILPHEHQMLAVTLNHLIHESAPGYKGIPEPLSSLLPERIFAPTSIDVAVIPGAVFDRRGYRLGYGGGYYDRFLALEAPQALRVGLAFSEQVVETLPALPHDVPMDVLVTEQELLVWSRTDRIIPSINGGHCR